MIKTHIHVLLASLAMPAAAAVQGETILIPLGLQRGTVGSTDLPVRGMMRDRVLARYGPPARATAPVGDPPISRWHYDGFTVYFEGDTVVHSVVTHVPRHPVAPSSGPSGSPE